MFHFISLPVITIFTCHKETYLTQRCYSQKKADISICSNSYLAAKRSMHIYGKFKRQQQDPYHRTVQGSVTTEVTLNQKQHVVEVGCKVACAATVDRLKHMR